MSKPIIIKKPTKIQEGDDKKKIVEEYVGIVNSGNKNVSIAHMHTPPGWLDIGQRSDFNEFVIVLNGTLQVEFEDGAIEINSGQAGIMHKGKWVRYSTSKSEGAEYISVCLPAFSLENVHKDKS